jgi:DHA1 family bicyclomycin/chloramphenicol resistance-like MFS transporter
MTQTTTTKFSRKYFVFLIVFLGMLSAFGPFVTDMYLPALPSMASVFHTTASMVQMGLTASMIGLGVGQLIFGPLSDRYGRKPVLNYSLLMFSIATAISIFSPTIEFFTVMRLFQGIGAAGGLVLSRSIATDAYSGRELAKTMAIIGAVNGIAPVTAPVVGGIVAGTVGWQGIFVILFIIGIALMLMCKKYRETLPSEMRTNSKLSSAYTAFFKVLKIRRYVLFLLASGFANAVLFGYISSAPFVIQDHFGLSEMAFSLCFAVNSVAIGIGATVALKFKRMENAGTIGAAGMVLFAVAQYAGYLTFDSIYCYMGVIFLMLLSMGLVFTATSSSAMDAGREYTGAAAAIFGALAFFAGGLVSPIVGIGNLMQSMSITLIVASVLTFVTMLMSRRTA